MSPIIIRQETPNDHEAIFAVNLSAFGQNEEARLVNALRKNPDAFIPELALVAISDEQLIGHILFTRIQIVDDNGKETTSLALAPMSVLPGYQNQGVGSQLVTEGIKRVREAGYKSVIVLGHPEYYPKFGFTPASRWNIKTHYPVPDEVFMAIELIPGALKNVSGMVRYAKEFDNL